MIYSKDSPGLKTDCNQTAQSPNFKNLVLYLGLGTTAEVFGKYFWFCSFSGIALRKLNPIWSCSRQDCTVNLAPTTLEHLLSEFGQPFLPHQLDLLVARLHCWVKEPTPRVLLNPFGLYSSPEQHWEPCSAMECL